MGEAKTGEEFIRRNVGVTTEEQPTGELDPGAYIGREPEREAETIPGGVRPEDERVAAHDSRPGASGEPEDSDVGDLLRGGSGGPAA